MKRRPEHEQSSCSGLLFVCSYSMNQSNALSGLHIISTTPKSLRAPYQIGLCQCPKRATYHFYKWQHVFHFFRAVCVNALSGLHIISTLPLQEWRISAIFQGCLCRYFSEYSDKCCLGILFRACSYFVPVFPNTLTLTSLHSF